MATIFIPKEADEFETRIAASPETVKKLVAKDFKVQVENGAGVKSHISNAELTEAGAEIVDGPNAWGEADVVLKVLPLRFNETIQSHEASVLKPGCLVVSFVAWYQNLELVEMLAERKVSALAMDLIPRISRSQTMDALSSQASIAGYKAVIIAANRLEKYFPQLMTAAGTVKPSRVVIMGAGVAGLQAIATAKRLGAIVEVSDIRPEVKEQVESLGGKFIDFPLPENGKASSNGHGVQLSKEQLQKQQEIIASRVAQADVVVTTALVPGKPAPVLVTEEMVKRMRPGSVIVDIAVEQGGNCELSKLNQDVEAYGVTIMGYSNLATTLPKDASLLYSRNILSLTDTVLQEGNINLDLEDEIISGCLITYDGSIRFQPAIDAIEEAIES